MCLNESYHRLDILQDSEQTQRMYKLLIDNSFHFQMHIAYINAIFPRYWMIHNNF